MSDFQYYYYVHVCVCAHTHAYLFLLVAGVQDVTTCYLHERERRNILA